MGTHLPHHHLKNLNNKQEQFNIRIFYYITLDEKGEIIYDPLRYDGYIVRTIQEDINYEEMEKSGKNIKKIKKK